MSAILETDGALGIDGIRRYHTTCKVILSSHVNDTHVLSQDVVALNLEKNIKGVGGATITLVASRNYLNIIHPNDYINIYIDVGDGEGWTRVFFGFVDMIRERYTVAENGEPSTVYTVRCSDFQKAFERIQIYFNAWMATRDDFTNNFGVTNIGGVALITAGITASGSPADIIRNIITLMFGFGSQFVLPHGYGADSAVVSRNRFNRVDYLKGELGTLARSALLSLGSFEELKAKLDEESGLIASDIASLSASQAVNVLRNTHQLTEAEIESLDITDATDIQELISDGYYRKRLAAGKNSFNETDPAILEAIGVVEDLNMYSLLDVIDYFTLYEAESIDGWTVDTGIWESQGPLGQILKSIAHEEINEFFYDLRPVSSDETAGGEDIAFSRLPDEISGNLRDSPQQSDGVSYVPHIIMREYPFGTIKSIDGSEMHLTLPEDPDGRSAADVAGTFEVGALFSDKPNVPGRHTIVTFSQSLKTNVLIGPKATTRHLDVAVINSKEIVSSDLGRSDSDHFNLFEVYSGDFHLANIKYMMSDVLPITTPIHVMRHGLRLKKYTTKYARFNISVVEAVEGTNVDRDRSLFANLVLDPASAFSSDIPEGLTTPVPEEPDSSDGSDGTETPVTATTIQSPVDLGTGNTGRITSAYGYRTRIGDRVVPSQSAVSAAGGNWVFHNGVDIRGVVGTPVFASMDGIVVASVPNGVFNGYGNCVVIKHTVPGFSDPIYSLYAHLDTRSVGTHTTLAGGRREGMSADLISNGAFPAEPITMGTQVGTVGRTFGKNNAPTSFSPLIAPHLHFEYIRKHNNRVYPSQNKGSPKTVAIGATVAAGFAPDVTIPIGTATPFVVPSHDNVRSLNPQDIHGILGALIPVVSGIPPLEDQIQDAEAFMDDNSLESSPSGNPTGSAGDSLDLEQAASLRDGDGTQKRVDTTTTRKQILRWGLLQDHWYQHNLEYLSGQIVMRGAPEIRCGYRLDIEDRRMSFYVDGVSHSWTYPNQMITTLTVSRGQSNNPHPLYVMPAVPAYDPKEQRTNNTRLGYFQLISDPVAVQRSIVFRNSADGLSVTDTDNRAGTPVVDGQPTNFTDIARTSRASTLVTPAGAVQPGEPIKDSFYSDFVMEAETNEILVDEDFEVIFSPDDVDLNTALDDIIGQDLEGPLKK